MPITDELVVSIDQRLADARAEIVSLEAALAALRGLQEPARPRAPARPPRVPEAPPEPAPATTSRSPVPDRPARAKSRKPRARRRAKPSSGTKVLLAGQLERMLRESGDLATSTIAADANADRDQVLTLLRELESSDKIRRTGQRRSTRWHLITDEERIAARAAEIAAQSKLAKS